MQNMRDLGYALTLALISVGLMVGSLSISLVEFVPDTASTNTLTQPPPQPVTITATFPPTFTPTFSAESPTPTITLTATITSTPPLNCPVPQGWTLITVQYGDTLETIASRYATTADVLRSGNCLLVPNLVAGSQLWVPIASTATVRVCNKGAVGWVPNYVVQRGDTLYSIAINHYTTLDLMRNVNCRTGDLILAGEVLWVPNVATRTPAASPLPGLTITPPPTEPLTETALPFTPTFIPTNTPVPATNTPIPTSTPIPTQTPSLTAFPP